MDEVTVTVNESDTDYPDPILQPEKHTGCLVASAAFVCRWFGIEASMGDVAAYRIVEGTEERTLVDTEWYPRTQGIRMARHTIEGRGIGKRWWLGPSTLPWVVQRLSEGRIAIMDIERVRGYRHAVVLVEARPDSGLVMDPLTGYVEDSWPFLLGDGPGDYPFPWVNHRVRAWYWTDKTMPW